MIAIRFLGLLLLGTCLVTTGRLAGAADSPTFRPAFVPGEKLVFELRWTFITAGTATLEVMPMQTIDGQPAYHFAMTAKSNAFLDTLYKVRDRIDALADAGLTRSVHYLKKQREGNTIRDIEVRFDWDNLKTRYLKTETGGGEDKLTPVMPGSFDPLSAFYFVRGTEKVGVGSLIERPITDGNKNIIGRVTVVKRETIKVKGTKYDTFLVEPELKDVGGVFEKSKNARIQIWVTADHRRMPVRLKSKVIVGSFVGDLVSATGLAP
ncbi:MAG: DUF3108 domain-containing protein [Desulfobacterales bacterium]|nr:DUF3108 domain-containing protein [Desulfobacterales bacterium]